MSMFNAENATAEANQETGRRVVVGGLAVDELIPSQLWRQISGGKKRSKLPKGPDLIWDHAVGMIGSLKPRKSLIFRRVKRVLGLEGKFLNLSDARLKEELLGCRDLFRLGREKGCDVERAFALIREASMRALGMKPYAVQLAAGLASELGMIAEMSTGEGKTLSVTLPAILAGWRGAGCHVLTVNDYLSSRDEEEMSKLYRFCGVSSGSLTGETPAGERRAAYLCDITYATNKEVAADFLRDSLALGRISSLPDALLANFAYDPGDVGSGRGALDRCVMRGLSCAIIDEADSIMVDEAVTPLIISADSQNQQQIDAFAQAAEVAKKLKEGDDYKLNHKYNEVTITDVGQEKIQKLSEAWGGIWSGKRRREEMVDQAINAKDFFLRGKQYIIQEDKIVIVDQFTGRLMPDRTWRDGLHQAVEAKEGVEIQPPKATMARVSFQRFFKQYDKLSGLSGTVSEALPEFWQVYHMHGVVIPTHRPCLREQMADQIYATKADKWAGVVGHIERVHETGRPILVGTRTVKDSEHLAGLLKERGLVYQVLNAIHHEAEAGIVSQAGAKNRITVATNMAGRGTDIKLGAGVKELGGLHVIATDRQDSGRVDRQLFGRAGRQGDLGSAIAFASFEDELILKHAPRWAKKYKNAATGRGKLRQSRQKIFDKAQRRAQRIAMNQRKSVMKTDDWLDEFLGFAGAE